MTTFGPRVFHSGTGFVVRELTSTEEIFIISKILFWPEIVKASSYFS